MPAKRSTSSTFREPIDLHIIPITKQNTEVDSSKAMGYSTKNMHISFADGLATDGSFADHFIPLPKSDFQRLLKAVDDAIGRGAMMDLTVIITFCSNVFFDDIDFADLVEHIKITNGVRRITTAMPDLISVLHTEGFMVNIRLVGTKKFVQVVVGEGTTLEDSFESVENLTQQCTMISMHCTPKK
jgi:hypothetical protein